MHESTTGEKREERHNKGTRERIWRHGQLNIGIYPGVEGTERTFRERERHEREKESPARGKVGTSITHNE